MNGHPTLPVPGYVISWILAALLYIARLLYTAAVVREELRWRKFRNMGSDLVALGMGAGVGAISRAADRGAFDLALFYNLVGLIFFLVIWMGTYSVSNPIDAKESIWFVQSLAVRKNRDEKWVREWSWAVRFGFTLVFGAGAYVAQLFIALL